MWPSSMQAARRRARGMTVYIVLLVIAMLSAVGVFATRSASLAVAQSGYFRQSVQTHYVTEYAVLATLAAIETDTPGYIAEMEAHTEEYQATEVGSEWRKCRTYGENQRCYKFAKAGIESRLSGATLIADRPNDPGGEPLDEPGSLGRADVEANFMVEATELAQVVGPIAGQRATDMPVTFYAVTLSSTGQVGPPGAPGNSFTSAATSVETARVQVTLGPVPAR
jgi:hypothetical protein